MADDTANSHFSRPTKKGTPRHPPTLPPHFPTPPEAYLNDSSLFRTPLRFSFPFLSPQPISLCVRAPPLLLPLPFNSRARSPSLLPVPAFLSVVPVRNFDFPIGRAGVVDGSPAPTAASGTRSGGARAAGERRRAAYLNVIAPSPPLPQPPRPFHVFRPCAVPVPPAARSLRVATSSGSDSPSFAVYWLFRSSRCCLRSPAGSGKQTPGFLGAPRRRFSARNMSDGDQIFIFGSFTEEETSLFRRQLTGNNKVSKETTQLQFGSLDFASIISTRGLTVEKAKPVVTLITGSNLPSAVIEEKYGEKKLLKVQDTRSTCCYSDGGSLHKDVLHENGKDRPGMLPVYREKSGLVEEPKRTENDDVRDGISKAVVPSICGSAIQENGCNHALPMFPSCKLDAKKALNGISMSRSLQPRGLINSGNLCFLNATLQALLSCLPFVQLLEDIRTRNIPKVGYPTLCAFVKFITDFELHIVSSSKSNETGSIEIGKSFSPIMFEGILRNFTPDVPTCGMSGRPRQEDAQEFLSFVMDQMHDELLKLGGDSKGLKSSLVSSVEEDGWETVGPKNRSAITRTQSFVPSELSEIFGGQLRSVVKARGNKASATVQPFLLLHLDIFPEAVHTIVDALHLFSAPENLEDYKTCAGKDEVVTASKSVKIQTLSKILILHLMRFSYGIKGSTKLHKPVHFPFELVVGRELLVSPSTEGRKYELFATISHHGRDPSKGHYTADTKHSGGQWLRYDDASVTPIGTSEVLHDQAYVLFYRQV